MDLCIQKTFFWEGESINKINLKPYASTRCIFFKHLISVLLVSYLSFYFFSESLERHTGKLDQSLLRAKKGMSQVELEKHELKAKLLGKINYNSHTLRNNVSQNYEIKR